MSTFEVYSWLLQKREKHKNVMPFHNISTSCRRSVMSLKLWTLSIIQFYQRLSSLVHVNSSWADNLLNFFDLKTKSLEGGLRHKNSTSLFESYFIKKLSTWWHWYASHSTCSKVKHVNQIKLTLYEHACHSVLSSKYIPIVRIVWFP